MTTVELLAYCWAQKIEPCIPDLVWQHEMQRDENLGLLCDKEAFLTPNGFHDMHDAILEDRSWLRHVNRTYATVLFTERHLDYPSPLFDKARKNPPI